MITAVLFVAAAGAGALARAEAGRRWNRHDGIAIGTIVVNITGSFCLGLLSQLSPPALTVVGVGGLGAYTTFSSFARDTAALVERKRLGLAATYVALTCLLGIGAAAMGIGISSA